jgi:hypothetical protein
MTQSESTAPPIIKPIVSVTNGGGGISGGAKECEKQKRFLAIPTKSPLYSLFFFSSVVCSGQSLAP